MPSREWMHEIAEEPSPTNLVMRSGRNWTAVAFLAALGALHLSVWLLTIQRGRAEAYMSLIFGCTFLLSALVCCASRYEIAVIPSERKIRVRTGCRMLMSERSIPFSRVNAVRLTLASERGFIGGRVELLCRKEDILCPATPVARVEALCLAITLGVRLIKVIDGETKQPSSPRRTADAEQINP